MAEPNIYISVAHHKDGPVISNGIIHPIHVGAAISATQLDMNRDDSGENISGLNPLYCELTAIYWMWKNIRTDYAGLCHYRRYFTLQEQPAHGRLLSRLNFCKAQIADSLIYHGQNKLFTNQIETDDFNYVEKLVNEFSENITAKIESGDYDIVTPSLMNYSSANNLGFFSKNGEYHIRKITEIIRNDYPELCQHWGKSLLNNKLYPANMFIMKWPVFNEYCTTVFGILEKHRKALVDECWCNDPMTEKCCSRLSGYLAELITDAFINMSISRGRKCLQARTVFYSK